MATRITKSSLQIPSAMFVSLVLAAAAARAGDDPASAGQHAAVRAVDDVMSRPPLVEIENSLRAWAVEKSEDFGVVLIEVIGRIPLHMHPDGNRRMFVVEGRVKMLGGSHEMGMKPGDFMYLPRDHHHKVCLAPGAERALILLVDNPPTSTSNVIWLDPEPEVKWNRDQVGTALRVDERCEVAPAKPAN